MSYVMIRHEVANYAKWKRGVKAFAKFRKASGEKSFYACRSSKDPNDVLVWCAWDHAGRMKKFVKSRELRKAMKAVGVISKPEVSFYSQMDDLSVG
jgi:heme-degrading monooxygenase HmoA